MKQTKFFLFFILFSFCVSAQNRPGVNYFAQFGFFDFIVNFKSPPNGLSTETKSRSKLKRTIIILTNF